VLVGLKAAVFGVIMLVLVFMAMRGNAGGKGQQGKRQGK